MKESSTTPVADEAIRLWDKYHEAIRVYGADSRQAKNLRVLYFLAIEVNKVVRK